jgi:KilA-N domain
MANKHDVIKVGGHNISIWNDGKDDSISLTDIVKSQDDDFFISDWLRNANTLDYIGAWEQIYNPNFNYGEFALIRSRAGSNTFKISVKELIERTNVISIKASAGRYGGTYAHKDIAFNFCMWISPVFQLYIVKEYQRLKEIESNSLNLEWDVRRLMTKVNYVLHTDAVQKHIIPNSKFAEDKKWIEYAEEADLLNLALYGYTAKQWKEAYPQYALEGKNMRDFSSITDLLIMSNLESLSSQLINLNTPKATRFEFLKKMADDQREQFKKVDMVKSIKKTNPTTYLNAENLTPDEIETESKKDILEANKQALSEFNKNLKKGLNFDPNADKE